MTAVVEENGYDSRWWALIYDQWNEAGGRCAQRKRELAFYRGQLQDTRGPILEAACGTGSIMLPLIADGFDVCGFDSFISDVGGAQGQGDGFRHYGHRRPKSPNRILRNSRTVICLQRSCCPPVPSCCYPRRQVRSRA